MSDEPIEGVPARLNTTRDIKVVEDHGPVSHLMDTSRFEHLQRIARVMGEGSLLPDHLKHERGNSKAPLLPAKTIVANCLRICNQALRWGMDPFAIVDETYVVGGKLAYQGKLVAAVVNSRAGLDGRLHYSFTGKGDDRTITVSGCFKGDGGEVCEVQLRLGDAKTQNQMWKTDPDQKLVYSAVVKWARRYCPEVVLGVLTTDDLERMGERVEHDNRRASVSNLLVVEKDDPEPEPAPEYEPEEDPDDDVVPQPADSLFDNQQTQTAY